MPAWGCLSGLTTPVDAAPGKHVVAPGLGVTDGAIVMDSVSAGNVSCRGQRGPSVGWGSPGCDED